MREETPRGAVTVHHPRVQHVARPHPHESVLCYHSFAIRLVEDGYDLRTVQKRLDYPEVSAATIGIHRGQALLAGHEPETHALRGRDNSLPAHDLWREDS